MARWKTGVTLVRVRVLVAFNGMRAGDEALVPISPVLQAWANAGLVEVNEDGEDQAGQGSAEPDAEGGEPEPGGNGGAPGGGES